MNVITWILTGGIAGWVGYSYMKLNLDRGMALSVVIGVLGGFFGGNVVAPMLGAVLNATNDFSLFSMVVALASAVACLTLGNLISERYGF
jgi:uncharacterized membrane protein YeaQ/YmgE (transglycosylase-associated protein family)